MLLRGTVAAHPMVREVADRDPLIAGGAMVREGRCARCATGAVVGSALAVTESVRHGRMGRESCANFVMEEERIPAPLLDAMVQGQYDAFGSVGNRFHPLLKSII